MEKIETGIPGFDRVLGGGLPAYKSTLVVGGPGAGKTLFGIQLLANFVNTTGNNALFVTFEEHPDDLIANTDHFTWNVRDQVKNKKIVMMDARLSPNATFMGQVELDGMMGIIAAKIAQTQAKLLVLDGLDLLLSMQPNQDFILQQMFNLDRFLRDQKISTIITIKAVGVGMQGVAVQSAQYVVDCVIELDRRLESDVAVSTLRVVKSRGASVVGNRIPMAINGSGIELLTQEGSIELSHKIFYDRVTTGIERLDGLLGGGFYRGTTVLVSGSPGTAKTTISGHVLEQACKNNERALFVSFDESEEQIVRNLASVNIDLQPHIDAGRLKMLGMRAAASSAYHHVLKIRHMVEDFKPNMLVIDPVTALVKAGGQEVANVLAELLVDFVKSHGITTIFTALVDSSDALAEMTSTHISTMADTWLHLTFAINGGERNRALTIVKSRGSAHSNQVRELILSASGIRITDVYSAGGRVLMGTARVEAEGQLQLMQDRERFEKHQRERQTKAKVETLKAQLIAIEAELEASEADVVFENQFENVKDVLQERSLQEVLSSRSADRI